MKYTHDWTTENFPVWRHFLQNFIGTPGVRLLEIGSYEGRSAVWFCENILTGNDSKIVCIDPWHAIGNDYYENFDLSSVKKRFDSNVKEILERGALEVVDDFSKSALPKMMLKG